MELGVSLLVFICGGLFCGILAVVLISSIKKIKKKYVFFVGDFLEKIVVLFSNPFT